MAEYPILFSGDMVKAILDGHKSQTRRIVKGKWLPLVEEVLRVNGKWVWSTVDYDLTTPYGQVGDRLWVRETWEMDCYGDNWNEPYQCDVLYRADGEKLMSHQRWKPSIHMPRWASRIDLEVTGIRVERLQAMTEEDAEAEGFCWSATGPWDNYDVISAQEQFGTLWDTLNAKRGYSWQSNPWVWVIEFKQVEG